MMRPAALLLTGFNTYCESGGKRVSNGWPHECYTEYGVQRVFRFEVGANQCESARNSSTAAPRLFFWLAFDDNASMKCRRKLSKETMHPTGRTTRTVVRRCGLQRGCFLPRLRSSSLSSVRFHCISLKHNLSPGEFPRRSYLGFVSLQVGPKH